MKHTAGNVARLCVTLCTMLLSCVSASGLARSEAPLGADSAIRARTLLGIEAAHSGRPAEAVEHMQWVYDYARSHGLHAYYYNASINLADALLHDGQLVEAATMLRRGLFYCDSLGLDTAQKVPFYITLSQIYTRFGDYKTAMRYSDDALPLVGGCSPLDYSSFWNTRGNIHFFTRHYAEARDAFLAAIAATEGIPELDYAHYAALTNLQDVRVRLEDYDGVDARLDSCEAYYRKLDVADALNYVFTIRAELCLFRDGDLREAKRYLEMEPTDNTDEGLRTLRRHVLYFYYTRAGEKDSVIAILREARAWRDSMLNNVSNMRMADIELQFRESMREHDIRNIEHQRRRETTFLLTLALTLAGLLLFLIFWMRSRSKVRLLRLQQTQDRLMLERLRSSRQRLTPHYLMNLVRLVRSSDDLKTEQIAMTLRESLAMSDRIGVTLAEEQRFVTSFLSLLPRAEGFRVVWDIDPAVRPDEQQIPGMCVQLAVENAVKYAYPPDYEGERLIRVVARHERQGGIEGLCLTIEDDGRGFGPHAPGTSLGIPILARTISLLNFYNRHALDMRIMDRAAFGDGHGVRVAYFFPVGTRFDLDGEAAS